MSTYRSEYFEIEDILQKLSLRYAEIANENDENLLKFESNSVQIIDNMETVQKLEDAFIKKYDFDKIKEIKQMKNEHNLYEEYVVGNILNIQNINKSISKLLYNKNYKKVEPIFNKIILGLAFVEDNKENLKAIDQENLTFQFKKSLVRLLMFVNKEVLNTKFTIMEKRFKVNKEEEDLLMNENLMVFIASEIAPFFKMTSITETYFNKSQFFNRDIINMNNDLFIRYFTARYQQNFEKINLLLNQLENEDNESGKQLLLINFNNDLKSFIAQEYAIFENLLSYKFEETEEDTVLNEYNSSKLKKKQIEIKDIEIVEKINFNNRFVQYLQNILNDLQFLKKINNLIISLSLDDVIMGVYSYNKYFEYDNDNQKDSLSETIEAGSFKKINFKNLVQPLLENFHIRLFKLIKKQLNEIEEINKDSLLSIFDVLIKIYDILSLPIFTNFLNYIITTILQNNLKCQDDEKMPESKLQEKLFFILVIQNFIKNFELDIESLHNNIQFDSVSLSTVATTSKSTDNNLNLNSIEVLSSVFTSLVSKLINNNIKFIFKNKFEIHSNEDYLKLNEFILIDLKQVYRDKYKDLETKFLLFNKNIDVKKDIENIEDVNSDLSISLAIPSNDIAEFLSSFKNKLNLQILLTYSQLSKINTEELVSVDTLKEAIEF
ncbi:hypothetical protein QEN19_001754 [Hanseniaspora menglaensis]